MSQYTNTFFALPEFESTGNPTIRYHKIIRKEYGDEPRSNVKANEFFL